MTKYDRETLVSVLVYHGPTDSSGCWCGWNELGRSLPKHIADMYEQAIELNSEIQEDHNGE